MECTVNDGRLGSQRLLALQRLVEGGWPVGSEDRPALDDPVREGEAEVGDEELLDVGSANIGSLRNLDDSQDLNRAESGAVSGGHVLVERVDSIRSGELSELLVHVVCA